jgi:hypothetical protein
MEKQRFLAISVTTDEALRLCLKEQCTAICVENPLYPEIKERWDEFTEISDYQIIEYKFFECIILKKVRGDYSFDEAQYELHYYAFRRR